MKSLIEKIIVTERVRKEITKIDELAEDIKANGLLHPIIVMSLDGGEYRLLAGLRRLRAVEKLGEIEIEVKTVSPANAEAELRIEISENEQREPFTFSETVDYGRLLDEIEKANGKERMSLGGKHGKSKKGSDGSRYLDGKKSSEVVGEKIGMSGRQYERAKYIADKASPEIIDELDKGKRSIYGTYNELRSNEKAKTNLESSVFETDNSTDNRPYPPQSESCNTIVENSLEDVIDELDNSKHIITDACDKPRSKEKAKKISKPSATENVETSEELDSDSDCQKNDDSEDEVNSQPNVAPKSNAPPSSSLSKADEEAIERNKAFNALPPQKKVIELQRQLKEERARAARAESELERLKELRHNDIFHKDGIINNLRERLEEAESRVKELEDLYGAGEKI